MRALRLAGWQAAPEIQDVDTPEPGPGEVLVRIAGAGACHSDLHIMEWGAGEGPPPIQPPFTLGHENAGYVHALGGGVDGVELEEPVAVYGPWGCGRCRPCRRSEESLCDHTGARGGLGGGLGLDGGMAEYLLVPSARLLVPLGELDPIDAAPLTDAGLTPYHAIKQALPLLVPGSTAVVVGVGGLGHLAVQIVGELSSARIIAVDTSADKLDHAMRLGADETLVAGPENAQQIRELTGGLGADLVLDLVGADATIATALAAVRAGGHVSLVGLGGGAGVVGSASVPFGATVTVPYWGSAIELMEVLSLAAAGRLRVEVERFTLDQATDAYDRMRAGTLAGRAVITPNGVA